MRSIVGLRLARSGVLVFACVTLLWAFVAWPWLSGAVTIPYDAKAHFQAQLQFLANALHRGDSPFWTPNVFGGSPQIADPQSLIFSPALLLALLDANPSFRALDAYVLGMLLLGGLAVAQFGRERGWPAVAQIVAALVFCFGASASWRLQHVGQVQSLACFAVAFWLLARCLKHGSWRSGLAAGAAAGVMVVTPDQIAFLGVLVLAAYVAWFVFGRDWRAKLRHVGPALATASLAGALIVTAPLLMTWLFSQMSSRPEIDFVEAGRGSLHPAFLLTAFVADLFGAADPKVDFWGPSSGFWAPGSLTLSQNMGQVYVGALPALAVLAWLFQGWRRIGGEARFLIVALAGMILYALGWYTPAFQWMFALIPGVDMFRRPADATFMIGALMAFLSGCALTGLIAAARDHALDARRLALAGIVAGSALLAGAGVAIAHGKLAIAWPALLSATIWLALAAALLAFALRKPLLRHAPVAAALIVATLAVDFRLHNGPNESTALPPAAYAELQPDCANDTIAYIKAAISRSHALAPARRDRVEFVGAAFHWPNLGMIHGFDHALGYNPLHLAEFTEATGAKDHMGETGERPFSPLMHSYRSRFAEMLGLRWIVSKLPIEQVDRSLRPGDLRLVARTRDGLVYENPRALPRALFVGSWRLDDFEEARERGLPEDFDPRGAVLLESAPEDIRFAAPNPERDRETKVRIVSYANAEVVIEIETDRPGFVVLNDVWHPWWTATVNGEEADILKANVLFRAVQVEAGKSQIRFVFKPFAGMVAELREKLLGEDEDDAPATMIP